MKNTIMMTIIALFIFGITSTSFAATVNKSLGVLYTTYEGTITDLMPNQNAVMLKDNDDGKIVHLHVDASTFAALKAGDTVRVIEQGGNCVLTDVKRK